MPVGTIERSKQEDIEAFENVDLKIVLAPLVEFLRNYEKNRSELLAAESSTATCTNIAKTSVKIRNGFERLQANTILKRLWSRQDFCFDAEDPLSIPLHSLLRIEIPILILGGPGAGKSTALRWLCRSAAQQQDGPLPILLSLATVKAASAHSLIEACALRLQEAGYYPEQTDACLRALEEKLTHGTVRLFLDGLDEAGSDAENVLNTIDGFSEKFPRTSIVLSCRDALGLKLWKKAFVVHLRAFTDTQIDAFIRNWFKVEAKAGELKTWLQHKPRMLEAARTPLIAALLCSLFELQADLPSTEVDLYERRYELLLGRWDQAKGLVSLSPNVRRSYLRALDTLAFFLHQNERRTATVEEVTSMIKRFSFPGIHCTPTELVEDCVRRGVLERQHDGQFGLGHLTYQEYLAACWLQRRNDVAFIWTHLTEPWWRKVLEFYAAKTEDLTSLLKIGLSRSPTSATTGIVDGLVTLAPFTSKPVLKQLRTLSMTPEVLRDTTVRQVDTIDLD
jgi:predicted NACHT family NTPase